MKKQAYLKEVVEHIDITSFDAREILRQYKKMSFQARNLARAAAIYDQMISDTECGIIFCLAGSLISAGLKKAVTTLMDNNMIDIIVATGANIVDQDFFEALGFKHYIGTQYVDDDELMKLHIDRIYDTYIDEDELRICDETVKKIADKLPPKPYSSREFIKQMGKYLVENNIGKDSITRIAYEKEIPIFVPAFSDCSAGFGLVAHQTERIKEHKPMVTIDSARDFLELTNLKLKLGETGLVMLGGGVPKNFAQDIVVAADILGYNANLHKYAIQITVADERDGGLSGSTLKEAHSWGKVDQGKEQMVFAEATLAFPLLASYVYHEKNWTKRKPKRLNSLLEDR